MASPLNRSWSQQTTVRIQSLSPARIWYSSHWWFYLR